MCRGGVLVRFKPGVSRAAQQRALDSDGVTATVVDEIEALHVEVVEVPEAQLEAALKSYRANPQIAFAELDTLVTVALAPNDPFYTTQQYGPQIIRAEQAWDAAQGAGAVIAVVDTGVDFGHPDLQGQLLAGGYDFVNNDGDPVDDHGHGTHVTGIAVAATNNGVGIAGIAPGAKVLPIKVLSSSGSGANSAMAQGIVYAADHGVKVINLSLGGFSYSQTAQDAVNYAWAQGVLVVAAAGNGNSSLPYYPAWYTHVIAVGATDSHDLRARLRQLRGPPCSDGPRRGDLQHPLECGGRVDLRGDERHQHGGAPCGRTCGTAVQPERGADERGCASADRGDGRRPGRAGVGSFLR